MCPLVVALAGDAEKATVLGSFGELDAIEIAFTALHEIAAAGRDSTSC